MVYVFLAEGFEEIEALTVVDVLRRADVPVETVSVAGQTVTGAHGIAVLADRLFTETRDDAEMLVLPGGMPGTKHLNAFEPLLSLLRRQNEVGRYIAAICAAPIVLGGMGLLQGKKAVCYPGMEDQLLGCIPSSEPVVQAGNLITSMGPGTAMMFALKLAEVLRGSETARRLYDEMQCGRNA